MSRANYNLLDEHAGSIEAVTKWLTERGWRQVSVSVEENTEWVVWGYESPEGTRTLRMTFEAIQHESTAELIAFLDRLRSRTRIDEQKRAKWEVRYEADGAKLTLRDLANEKPDSSLRGRHDRDEGEPSRDQSSDG